VQEKIILSRSEEIISNSMYTQFGGSVRGSSSSPTELLGGLTGTLNLSPRSSISGHNISPRGSFSGLNTSPRSSFAIGGSGFSPELGLGLGVIGGKRDARRGSQSSQGSHNSDGGLPSYEEGTSAAATKRRDQSIHTQGSDMTSVELHGLDFLGEVRRSSCFSSAEFYDYFTINVNFDPTSDPIAANKTTDQSADVMFEIKISNGCHSWDVKRMFSEVVALYDHMMVGRTNMSSTQLLFSMSPRSLPPFIPSLDLSPEGIPLRDEQLRHGVEECLKSITGDSSFEITDPKLGLFFQVERFGYAMFVHAGYMSRQIGTLERCVLELSDKVIASEAKAQESNMNALNCVQLCELLSNRVTELEVANNRSTTTTTTTTAASSTSTSVPSADVSADGSADGKSIVVGTGAGDQSTTASTTKASPPKVNMLTKMWEFNETKMILADGDRHSYEKSPDLELPLIPSNIIESQLDIEVNQVIQAVWPQQAQVNHRTAVVDFVSRLIKHTLKMRCYPTDFLSLNTFVPDATSHITIFSNGLHQFDTESNWCIHLSEHLCHIAQGNVDEFLADEGVAHTVKNVRFDHDANDGNFRLRAVIDGVQVSITSGDHTDLVFLATVEELDRLVGKDHLLKRSLLLIQSWWIYQSTSHGADSSMHSVHRDVGQDGTLNECGLCMMVCTIFNQYSDRIHHPLQALSLFFAEYSSLDFATHVITLFGVYPIATLNEGGVGLRKTHLMTSDHLEQYLQWFTLAKSGVVMEAPPSLMVTGGVATGVGTMQHLTWDNLGLGAGAGSDATFAAGLCDGGCFTVQKLNIAHPLCLTLNITKGMVATNLVTALKDSTRCLRSILSLSKDAKYQAGLMHKYFGEIFKRFGSDFRPDVGVSLTMTTPVRCDLGADLERLREEISYANMLIAGDVSDRGLKLMFRELLLERGALPVGEIGKVLQESTRFTTLTTLLKTIYGGLKKFLESCDDEFVIGRNHPFNPHVYLRKFLTNSDSETIMEGGIAGNYMAKTRKTKQPVPKRRQPSIPPSYSHPHVQQHIQGFSPLTSYASTMGTMSPSISHHASRGSQMPSLSSHSQHQQPMPSQMPGGGGTTGIGISSAFSHSFNMGAGTASQHHRNSNSGTSGVPGFGNGAPLTGGASSGASSLLTVSESHTSHQYGQGQGQGQGQGHQYHSRHHQVPPKRFSFPGGEHHGF